MLRYTEGDLLQDSAEAIVNTVNCVGVMGRGIALQFKKAFPANFSAYAAACKAGDVMPGRMHVFATEQLTGPKYIINFPTKRHWRQKSRMDDIEAGLQDLRRVLLERQIRSVAIPPLGCGLGGLDWHLVQSRIEAALADLDIQIAIYQPKGAPAARSMKPAPQKPAMTPKRAALIQLMHAYHKPGLDPEISLLAVHKLLYFLQVSGEPLRLQFVKHRYGPYAVNLRNLMNVIEGHFITGYADGGDQPGKQLEIVPQALQASEPVLQQAATTQTHLQRVQQLIYGFESDFGMELLATVHWVLTEGVPASLDAVVEAVHSWNARKIHFTPHHMRKALEQLERHGFMPQTAAQTTPV